MNECVFAESYSDLSRRLFYTVVFTFFPPLVPPSPVPSSACSCSSFPSSFAPASRISPPRRRKGERTAARCCKYQIIVPVWLNFPPCRISSSDLFCKKPELMRLRLAPESAKATTSAQFPSRTLTREWSSNCTPPPLHAVSTQCSSGMNKNSAHTREDSVRRPILPLTCRCFCCVVLPLSVVVALGRVLCLPFCPSCVDGGVMVMRKNCGWLREY